MAKRGFCEECGKRRMLRPCSCSSCRSVPVASRVRLCRTCIAKYTELGQMRALLVRCARVLDGVVMLEASLDDEHDKLVKELKKYTCEMREGGKR